MKRVSTDQSDHQLERALPIEEPEQPSIHPSAPPLLPRLQHHSAPPVFQPRPTPPLLPWLQHHLQPHPASLVYQPHPAPPLLPWPQHQLQPHPAPPVFHPRPAPPLLPRPQLPYGMYLNYDSTTMSNFMSTGCGTGILGVPTPFEPQPQTGGIVAPSLPGGQSSAIGLQPASSFYGEASASGVRPSESLGETTAVSLDGIGMNQPGRKRMMDGPTELMIERFQKRIIRNRESAWRSRARKQAYTNGLEAELDELKNENSFLKQRLREMESESKQLQSEAAKTEAQAKAKEKPGTLRRTFSCPF